MRRRYKRIRPFVKRRPGKRSTARLALFTIFSLFFISAAVFMSIVDKRLLPTVIKIEEYRINSWLNQAIDASISVFGKDEPLVSSDFYHKTEDSNGKIISLTANTILINEISAGLSQFVDEFLSNIGNDYVYVPVGALLGIEWLANVGPSYKISVLPIGACGVSYETSFTSAGINQINFQVWITISTSMQVVNPIQIMEVEVTRSIPLVNTIFAGEIPGTYINVN